MTPQKKPSLRLSPSRRRAFTAALSAVGILTALPAFAAEQTWDGAVNGIWDTSTANWSGSTFTSGNDALFTGSLTNNTVTQTSALTIGALTLASDWTGTVTLSQANTVSGATTISGGTLNLTNKDGLGTSAITVNSGGTLAINPGTGSTTVANNISGAGLITAQDPGASSGNTLTLSGNYSGFTGTFNILAGASNNGKVNFSNTTQANGMSSSATIQVQSGATLYENKALNYGAKVELFGAGNSENFGALRLEGGANQTGSVTLKGNSSIGVNSSAATISGNIGENGGSFGFTKVGNSTLTLTGANTYSGGTTVSSGTVALSGSGTLGATSGSTTVSGGTLDLGATSQTQGAVSISSGTIQNGTLTATSFTSTNGGTISATLAGTGATLTQNGSGTLILTGANTYTGATAISGGTLRLGNNGTTGSISTSSPISIATGTTFEIYRSNSVVQGTDFGTLSGAGNLSKIASGSLTLNASGSGYTGNTSFGGSTVVLDYSTNNDAKISTAGSLTLAGVSVQLSGGSFAQTVGSTTLNAGASSISQTNSGTATLALGAITRNAGGTLELGSGGFVTTSSTLGGANSLATTAAGVLGVVGGNDWIARDGTTGLVSYTTAGGTYNNTTSSALGGSGNQTDVASGVTSTTLAASASTSTLRFNQAQATTINAGGNTISLSNGGILVTSAVGNNLSTISNGTLAAGSNDALFIFQNNTANGLTISANIADRSQAGNTSYISDTLTKSGAGLLTLSGTNTYSGQTYLNGGTTVISADSGIGGANGTFAGLTSSTSSTSVTYTGSLPTGLGIGTTILGKTITAINDSTKTITLSGNAGTALTGGTASWANAQNLNLNGATLQTGGTFSLSQSNTGGTAGTSTVNRAVVLGDNGGTFDTTGGNLGVTGVVSGNGSLTKTGSNTLTISGANTYSGGTTINGGQITFASLGTGAITSNGGTLQSSTGAQTTSANLVVNGATTLDVTGGNWTINGNISGNGAITRGTGATLTLFLGGDNSGYTGTFTSVNNGNSVVRFSNTNAGSANANWVFNNTTANRTTMSFGTGTISFGSMTGAGNVSGDSSGTKTISVGALGSNDTFSGTITNGTNSSVIALTKVGTGTMTLSGSNTYTGGTSINNGAIQLDHANALGTSGTISFGGGALKYGTVTTDLSSRFSTAASQAYSVDTNGQSVTWATNLTSSGGSLAKSGGGTLTLTGSGNTYDDATNITGGTLLVSGSGAINGTSGITINGSGAKYVHTSGTASDRTITLTQGTVDGTGTLGTVNVANLAGNVVQNGNGGTSTLTIENLTFNGAATLNIADSGAAITPGISVTGALITTPLSGTVTINASVFGNAWSPTTYNLISYGSFSGSLSDFTKGTIAGLTSRQSATLGLDTIDQFITLIISGDNPRWSGLDSGNWVVGTTGSNSNWKLITSGDATDYIEADSVFFDDSVEGTTSVNISAANVSPTSVTFNNSGTNYTLDSTGGFGIAGTGSLTKTGTGTVTISTVNSYTGGTNINEGTLALSGSGTLGPVSAAVTMGGGTLDLGGTSQTVGAVAITTAAASGNVIQNGTLTPGSLTASNSTGNAIVTANLAGSGAVTMSGTGTLTLSGANNYTGGTTVGNGTLVLANGGSLSTSNTLTLGSSSDNASGTFQLGDSNGVANTTVTSIATAGSGTANAVVGGNSSTSTLTVNNSSAVSYAGRLGGSGTNQNNLALVKDGTGTLTLSGASTYSGGTTLNAGTLVFGNNSAFGTGTVSLNAGTLKGSGSGDWTLSNTISVAGTSTFDVAGRNTRLNGNIDGSAALTVANTGGAATLTFAGDNSGYGGTVTVNNGTAVNFASGNAGSAGAAWVFNDATSDRVRINLASGGTINFGSIAGSGQIQNDTASTTSTLSVGALNTSTTFSGTMKNGASNTGILALTKVGSGTLTLSGANTYTGDTVISAGTLALASSGSITSAVIKNNATLDVSAVSGGFSVASGQTLMGTGTVIGATTIASGATLAPGNSPGVITFNDALTLAGNTTMEANGTARGTNYDGINTGTGLLTYGGSLTITFGSTFLTGVETFDLFNIGAGGSTSDFGSVSVTGSYIIAGLTNNLGVWTGSTGGYNFTFSKFTGDLSVSAIPEPAAYAALTGALFLGMAALRRRRSSSQA